MDSLYPLFYENLQDNIPSVREGAAIALANVVKAYSEYGCAASDLYFFPYCIMFNKQTCDFR